MTKTVDVKYERDVGAPRRCNVPASESLLMVSQSEVGMSPKTSQ